MRYIDLFESLVDFGEDGNVYTYDHVKYNDIEHVDYEEQDFKNMESKLNDPLYHGSGIDFDKFSTPKENWRGIHFTSDKEHATIYAKSRAEAHGTTAYLYTVKVHFTRPMFTDETNDYRELLRICRKEGYDAIIGPSNSGNNPPINVTVLSAKQVQILSKIAL